MSWLTQTACHGAHCSLINFTVTRRGLEDVLLGELVAAERPELEEAKGRLVMSISNDKQQLQVRGKEKLNILQKNLQERSYGIVLACRVS